ncbi:colicin-like bacteriocin tRNase domain-containing protein [Xenorhabdus thuongxuanensis]|uniref:Colicin-E6 n=1 Tax=Xenorhabdus thuongxuanensis TaxID=1873484 RepID=A0A1Q5U2Y9_9GAMM|nr:colicin-like bacteriocin tRNase domain-containing protein [Xenorhabdus thuongxuanensis]OKP06849.1 Colicin-E6 [Xenorhabdus thuongxuanensis]
MHDTMTVTSPGPSKDAGWGNENGFGDYNGGGSSGGYNDSNRSAGYAVAALSMARPGIPALAFPVNGVLSATLSIGTLDTGFMNPGNYIDSAKPFATRLADSALGIARFGSRFAGPVAGIASLLLDLESRRQDLIENIAKMEREAIENTRNKAWNRFGITDVYQVTALPVTTLFVGSLAMDEINAKIRGKNAVIADVVVQPVVDTKNQQRQMAIIRNPTSVPVVKAERTSTHFISNDYTAQVVAGMKPMVIQIDSAKTNVSKNQSVVPTPAVEVFSSALMSDTSHAIIDFDGKHEPIYISVSKTPTVEEEKKQLEEAKKREQEWYAAHPLLAATLELHEAQTEFTNIDSVYQDKQNHLNQLLNSPEGLTLSDPVKNPLVFQQNEFQRNFIRKEVKINDRSLINILLTRGETPYLKETVARTEKEPGYRSETLLATQSFYLQLGVRLVNAHRNIEQTKRDLAPLMESRNKAESKKKEKEQKVSEEKEKQRKGVQQDGHKYYPAPKTEDIKGLGELRKGPAKTPKQGSGGKRARWIGEKGRRIYEWDSQHGELEGYRASNGEHLGSFDPKTGNQLKPADLTRNIKKYL